jgi:DNA-directed RNA polymerase specialized sigma24 family protein
MGASTQPGIEDLYRGEDRRALLATVGALPPRQREVLALKYFLDLGEQDIAAILHISRGAGGLHRPRRAARPPP